ncbi:MAG: zinc ribbon domain-containing protein [Anaerolineales bacterium]|nr:zinc ribbon domain-containing protein [Anaerolineales bacterium]
MPIYEYLCLDCGKEFEVVRPMKEADLPIPCQQCQGEHITRKLSVFNACSGGRVVAGASSGCAGCSASSCAGCKH